MRCTLRRSDIVLAGLIGVAAAETRSAYSLPPSGWVGIDGNWSTISLQVGADSKSVDVLIATALSETWVVGTGGCYEHEPHCATARHGLFDPGTSDSWSPLGKWGLGLDHLGYEANGDYGQDRIRFPGASQNEDDFTIERALISVLNTTDFFLGQIGLGITHGNFGDEQAPSLLTDAVETEGLLPSYSYGYTAGAHYRNMPASVTLGGYDKARFEDHDIEFRIPVQETYLHALVRGVEIQAGDREEAPDGWNSDARILSNMSSAFNVLFDSATPFMWLPDRVCDEFANALNLTYDDSLELYKVSNEQYREFRNDESHSFVFSFSSADNHDDFGDPLDEQGVVNITVPIRALVSAVEYPFKGEVIEYGSPALPYFSLRRSGSNSTFILGRSFLQESYLLVKYDSASFSVHQARFPSRSEEQTSIVAITQSEDSPYSLMSSVDDGGLSKGEIAGIVVGVSAAILISTLAWWVWGRTRKGQNGGIRRQKSMGKSSVASTSSSEEPKSAISLKGSTFDKSPPLLTRLLSKIIPRKQSTSSLDGTTQPTEVANNEIFEMPALVPPAELPGNDHDDIVGDDPAMGFQGGWQMSPYERARLRIDRQLAGPVPAYSPPADGAIIANSEKTAYGYEPARLGPQQISSPGSVSTQSPDSDISNTFPASSVSLISPVSGQGTGSMEFDPGLCGPAYESRSANTESQSRAESKSGATANTQSDHGPSSYYLPPATVPSQRTLIDPSRVVCLGPLPENTQIQHATPPRTIPGQSGERLNHPAVDYAETLGSDFTDEEDRMEEARSETRLHELRREEEQRVQQEQAERQWQAEQAMRMWNLERQRQEERTLRLQRQQERTRRLRLQTQGLIDGRHVSNQIVDPDHPEHQDRIDHGTELIHIPQPADKRYSWEDHYLTR